MAEIERIPDTLYRAFTERWLDLNHAPADAAAWYRQGYLQVVYQGKLAGYAITPKGYEWIVDHVRYSYG